MHISLLLHANAIERRETHDLFDLIASQVEFDERVKAVKVLAHAYLIGSDVEHAQAVQCAEILDVGDLIAVQVEYVEEGELAEVLDALDAILAEHEHAQVDERGQAADALDLVVVQVEEDETGADRVQVVYLSYLIVLVVDQLELALALDHRTSRHIAPFEQYLLLLIISIV